MIQEENEIQSSPELLPMTGKQLADENIDMLQQIPIYTHHKIENLGLNHGLRNSEAEVTSETLLQKD